MSRLDRSGPADPVISTMLGGLDTIHPPIVTADDMHAAALVVAEHARDSRDAFILLGTLGLLEGAL